MSVCSPPEKSHTRRHPKNHTFHKPFGLPPASRRAVGHAATAVGCGPAHSPTMVQISSVPWVRGTRRVPVAPDAASSIVPSSGIVGCQYRHLPDTIFDSRVRPTRDSIVGQNSRAHGQFLDSYFGPRNGHHHRYTTGLEPGMRLHLNQSSSSSSSSCKTKYIFGPNTRTDIWPAFPQLLPVVHVVRSAAVTPSLLIVVCAAGRLPGPSPR